MQSVFVLSFLALCIAVRSQQQCIAPTKEFTADATWLTSKSDRIAPNGEIFQSNEISKAIKTAANQKILSEPPGSAKSKRAVSHPCPSTQCPYHFRFIWKIRGCWVVKPIPVWPYLMLRPLRYAYCEKRTCQYFPWLTGRCRHACYKTYSPVLLACKGPPWYLRWIPYLNLPQCCCCRPC